jgi:FixJ family two-component response regulator
MTITAESVPSVTRIGIKSGNDILVEASIPGVALESILHTDELRRRPWRPRDHEKEKRCQAELPAGNAIRGGAKTTTAEDPIVFVIDDDPDMRAALGKLLRSVGLRTEVFATAGELMQFELPAVPSCLVLDVRLQGASGLDFQTELSRSGINIPIIFITGYGDIHMSVQAMKAGAIDFLTKPFRHQELLDAVTAAIGRDRKRRREEKSNTDVHARFASLTPRQRQVMAWVTGGLLNKQVAAKIGISEMTVKIHRGQVMRKMHVKSLADLVLIADRLGVRGQESLENGT